MDSLEIVENRLAEIVSALERIATSLEARKADEHDISHKRVEGLHKLVLEHLARARMTMNIVWMDEAVRELEGFEP